MTYFLNILNEKNVRLEEEAKEICKLEGLKCKCENFEGAFRQLLVYSDSNSSKKKFNKTVNGVIYQLINNVWKLVCQPMPALTKINPEKLKKSLTSFKTTIEKFSYFIYEVRDGTMLSLYYSELDECYKISSRRSTDIGNKYWRGVNWSLLLEKFDPLLNENLPAPGDTYNFILTDEMIHCTVLGSKIYNISKFMHLPPDSNNKIEFQQPEIPDEEIDKDFFYKDILKDKIVIENKETDSESQVDHIDESFDNYKAAYYDNLDISLDEALNNVINENFREYGSNEKFFGYIIRTTGPRDYFLPTSSWNFIQNLVYRNNVLDEKKFTFRSFEYAIANSFCMNYNKALAFFPKFARYYGFLLECEKYLTKIMRLLSFPKTAHIIDSTINNIGQNNNVCKKDLYNLCCCLQGKKIYEEYNGKIFISSKRSAEREEILAKYATRRRDIDFYYKICTLFSSRWNDINSLSEL